MTDLSREMIESLEQVLAQRGASSEASLRASVQAFLAALKRHVAAVNARGWSYAATGATSNELASSSSAPAIDERLRALTHRLHGGGFYFDAQASEDDLLRWSQLELETRSGVAHFAEACERVRHKSAMVRLSPPANAPGWFGAYDVENDKEGAGPARAPRVAGSGGNGSTGPGREATKQGVGDASGAGNAPGSGGLGSGSVCEGGAGSGAAVEIGATVLPASTSTVLKRAFDTVDVAHGRAAGAADIDVVGTRSSAEELVRSSASSAHDVLRQVEYATYDAYTVGHSVRVALLAVLVGRELGFDERALVELSTAGLLHDVGKARIAPEILFKPAALDRDERIEMSRHTVLGAEILIEQHDAGPFSVGAAFGHHLRHDGGGYPVVPRWYKAGAATEIVHVCDVFEALTAIRPYKPALSPRRAFEVMLADARAFHPLALRSLVRCMGIYPPGTHLELSSGERALVLSAGSDLARPRLLVTHDALGREVPEGDIAPFELGEVPTLSIVRTFREPAPHAHEPGTQHDCCR
ncbi:MAG: HD domain-containing protein [Planctomycetes bacterium]|nr:HD domain-containing protein [Planctomycetota bacterium]